MEPNQNTISKENERKERAELKRGLHLLENWPSLQDLSTLGAELDDNNVRGRICAAQLFEQDNKKTLSLSCWHKHKRYNIFPFDRISVIYLKDKYLIAWLQNKTMPLPNYLVHTKIRTRTSWTVFSGQSVRSI